VRLIHAQIRYPTEGGRPYRPIIKRFRPIHNISELYTERGGAGEAQSEKCLTTNWTTRVRSPTGAENFSSSLGYQESFPRGKTRPGRDADHSPLSSAEVKNE
jgi:hypothetical protein